MAIWLNKDSKVIVQGMTGATGMKHTKLMLGDGTEVVGGVNPRKAGQTVDFDGTEVPVFGTVKEAIEKTGANVSVIGQGTWYLDHGDQIGRASCRERV